MNPYEVLGVDPHANTDEIRSAYRSLAKQHHPDVGGDPDMFLKIQAAHDILTDTGKRRLYDELGIVHGTEEAFETNEAINVICMLWEQCMNNFQIELLAQTDVVHVIDDALGAQMSDFKKQLDTHQAAKSRFEKIQKMLGKKMKKKNPAQVSIFDHVMKEKLAMVESAIAQTEKRIKVIDRAKVLMDDYEFTPDEAKMQMQMIPINFGMFGGQSMAGMAQASTGGF